MNINIKGNQVNLIGFTGSINLDPVYNTISISDIKLSIEIEPKNTIEYLNYLGQEAKRIEKYNESIKKELDACTSRYAYAPKKQKAEDLPFGDFESIPDIPAPMEIVIKEIPVEMPEINIPSVTLNEKEKSSQGNSEIKNPKIELKADNSGVLEQIEIAERFLKSFKPEKPARPIPEAKVKQIEEGIIKFFKSRGKKTSFRYNYSEKSKPEAIKEAKNIQALCGVKEHRCICQVFKFLLSSGRIIEVGTQKKTESGAGGRFTLYSLNDIEYSKPKSRCPKCGGFSLVKNENRYSSDEDYYHDKDGSYFTCMMCGEEVVVESREAA